MEVEQRGPPMGYQSNNGPRRSELKGFNCQKPHITCSHSEVEGSRIPLVDCFSKYPNIPESLQNLDALVSHVPQLD